MGQRLVCEARRVAETPQSVDRGHEDSLRSEDVHVVHVLSDKRSFSRSGLREKDIGDIALLGGAWSRVMLKF